MAQRYCIGPDGDHRMTWAYAEADGFAALNRPEFEHLSLPGVEDATIRGFTRTVDGVEARVLTGASWIRAGGQGTTYSRLCWVSSSRASFDEVNGQTRSYFNDRGFRMGRVRVHAWIPRPDGSLEPVSRRRYVRESLTLARIEGMRQLFARAQNRAVFLAYASPRDEATYRDFDWSGPEPVPAPQR
ncbi:hypothetical protein [Brevundimonas sp.]|uniref:hypothetical protein n=1 Tax=Brevundimonas sp. TaxID=1871086 RepID=UPI003D12D299